MAHNATLELEKKPLLRSVDSDAIEAYMDKECRERPLESIFAATARLTVELDTN